MLRRCGGGRTKGRLSGDPRRSGGGRDSSGIGVAAKALQVGTKFGGGLAPKVTVLFQGLVDSRQFGIEAQRWSGCAVENGFGDDTGGFSAKRQTSGGHFIEDDTEG